MPMFPLLHPLAAEIAPEPAEPGLLEAVEVGIFATLMLLKNLPFGGVVGFQVGGMVREVPFKTGIKACNRE